MWDIFYLRPFNTTKQLLEVTGNRLPYSLLRQTGLYTCIDRKNPVKIINLNLFDEGNVRGSGNLIFQALCSAGLHHLNSECQQNRQAAWQPFSAS